LLLPFLFVLSQGQANEFFTALFSISFFFKYLSIHFQTQKSFNFELQMGTQNKG